MPTSSISRQDYDKYVENASRNLIKSAGSLDKVAMDSEITEQMLELRITKVVGQQYQHILKHLSEYVRITVEFQVDAVKTITVPVIVPRMITIEQLMYRIEAEFAFMHMEATIGNRDRQIVSVQVILLSDVASVPLQLESTVQDALNSGDVVHVTGIYFGMEKAKTQGLQVIERLQMQKLLLKFKDQPTYRAQAPGEVQLMAILHNLTALSDFQEFCMHDFEIENLLFWLEAEVFRNVCEQAIVKDESDFESMKIPSSSKHFQTLVLHARYIYYTFLDNEASLRLNLPSGMLKEFDWPIPKPDLVSGIYQPLKIDMFDEMQDRIFHHLAKFVLVKYQKSVKCEKFQERVKNAPEEFEPFWFEQGTHFEKFKQDVEGMTKAVQDAVLKHAQESKSLRSATTSARRSHQVIERQQSEVQEMDSYFGNGPRLTNAQKLRRMQREKKLKKFFGDVPQDIPADVGKLIKAETEDSASENGDPTLITREGTEDFSVSRKKKAEKLEGFFGVDKLPMEQLFEQHLISRITNKATLEQSNFSLSYINNNIQPTTKNDLNPETKRMLMQKSKKLQGMFGHMPDEATIQHTLSINQISNLPHRHITQDSGNDFLSSSSSQMSLAFYTENVKIMRDNKEYKRKKLERIQRFLGERIQASDMKPERRTILKNLSPKDKQAYFRRVNKLQGMFGEILPSEIMVTNSGVDNGSYEPGNVLVENEDVLLYLLSNDQNVSDLVDLLEDFDLQENVNSDIVLEENGQDIAKTFQQARQRRRVGKLSRFFGVSTGPISLELTVEDRMLVDLSHHLQDIVHPAVLQNMLENLKQIEQPGVSNSDISKK